MNVSGQLSSSNIWDMLLEEACQKNCAMDTRFGPSRSKCEFDQQLHDFGWQWTGGGLHSGSP